MKNLYKVICGLYWCKSTQIDKRYVMMIEKFALEEMNGGNMKKDLTQGNVMKSMLLFAGPMILGNLLQQCYNFADTFIVGKFIGADALAAVGSTYTLMTFLNSILIGLCMGCGSIFSNCYGAKKFHELRLNIKMSFGMLCFIAVGINVLVFLLLKPILYLLKTPAELYEMMQGYVLVVFCGIFFVFLYNYFSFLLRALGNSFVPLCFLGISSGLNVILDLVFILKCHWGVEGAAFATVIAQIFSAVGITIYVWKKKTTFFSECSEAERVLEKKNRKEYKETMLHILRYSFASCVQQSVMNFGILMIQGLVNSFGTAVMAAFAAAVKIDTLAYMPAQEFGNAFSLFISQNEGAKDWKRIKEGTKTAFGISVSFCIVVSLLVCRFSPQLMGVFIDITEREIIEIGTGYLRIEGAFYCGIGMLFLLYGYYRGIGRPEMSLILTIISLGTRVCLAYIAAPLIGVKGIWIAIPIGWALADFAGIMRMRN